MFAFDWLADPTAWAGLLTLVVLEIVLGIDNLVFVAILADKLPPSHRDRARISGLAIALLMRLVLLGAMSWLVKLTTPIVQWQGFSLSWRDIILLLGGAFLLFKATLELHERLEASDVGEGGARAPAKFWLVVAQIVALDAVFSLDSVITAVGIAEHIPIMVFAILTAVAIMLLAANPLGRFIDENPTVKMLALTFILLVGAVLILDGFEVHVPKPYIYFAMGFSVLVEWLNLLMRRKAVAHRVPGAGEW